MVEAPSQIRSVDDHLADTSARLSARAPDRAALRRGTYMQCAKLTDDELWRAIAQNTETMSALLREQAELDDADCIAIHVLASRFQREYRQYVAELQRRYP